jgi:Rad3-related DNA helicase
VEEHILQSWHLLFLQLLMLLNMRILLKETATRRGLISSASEITMLAFDEAHALPEVV